MAGFARRLLGRARDLRDPHVFHQMSLVAFLAWVGLGADGLSSSSYGPEEAFKAIGHWTPDGCYAAVKDVPGCHFVPDHAYLAVFLAGAIAATVFIISWSYRRIIEEFPHGGGGYIVATKHLGPYVGVALVFMRAFSLGGGTFTGIEAVSNGIGIMREPRVRTAKRTMLLMATSLAITASGILLAYLLLHVVPEKGKTMNGLLAQKFVGDGGLGYAFVVITMLSEGSLLFVAAQAGFVDGPRVMANMALDQWMPSRMAALSEQLTMRNGVYLMAAAAALVLLYTHGSVDALVVMYSINVFITFTLSNIAMIRHAAHTKEGKWQRAIFVHSLAASVCAMILVVTIVEKFTEGGWVTTLITATLVTMCILIRSHYKRVGTKVAELSKQLELDTPPPAELATSAELDPTKPTAVVLAGGYGGLGLHTLLQIPRVFPGQFDQVVFVAAGVIDAGVFKGKDEVDAMRAKIDGDLAKYVAFARTHMGWAADCDSAIGTEAVAELDHLCREAALRFPRSVFFAGKLIFQQESWYQRILHNETAAAVERRLQFAGLPMIVMPIRMFH